MFTNKETDILRKFSEGSTPEEGDCLVLELASLLGMVHFGATFKEGKVIPQARLTTRGKIYLKESELWA